MFTIVQLHVQGNVHVHVDIDGQVRLVRIVCLVRLVCLKTDNVFFFLRKPTDK
jgi:hypothetical protein